MRVSLTAILLAVAASAAGATAGAQAPAERPYTWQRFGVGAPGSTRVAYELGFGTRDSRFFGADGVEQRVGLRYQPVARVGVEAYGGVLVRPDQAARGAAGAEVIGRALSQASAGVDLDVAAGYGLDYRDRHVLRARAALGPRIGPLDLRAGGAVEVPLSGVGDAADVSLTLGGSLRVTPWWRQGLELGGEDLEGLWDEEEAKGGAKLLFGPTAYFALGGAVELRVNLAAIYAAPVAQATPADAAARWGVMGRASLAYTFGGDD